MPRDEHANDLVHRETVVVASNAEETAKRLRASGVSFVSSGVTELPRHETGFRKGFLVRDPDGHVLRVIEP